MKSIFLSASVPVPGRGNYFKTADPFLIQFAVREFVIATLGRRKILWGGHPAITPMVQAACQDLQVGFSNAVTLYQSKYFEGRYPEENKYFDNIQFTDAITGDLSASLQKMREQMISSKDLSAAVFIGGMEGVEIEYELFKKYHPESPVIAVASTGGAARDLAIKQRNDNLDDINFTTLFYKPLGISPTEKRQLLQKTNSFKP